MGGTAYELAWVDLTCPCADGARFFARLRVMNLNKQQIMLSTFEDNWKARD